MNKFKYNQLHQVCKFINAKIDVSKIDLNNYISTENMLQNKCGVTIATTIPNSKNVSSYKCHDILTSNIRPYFKKIWFAKKNGGCSNDVLVLRANKDENAKFLYYVLSDSNFFNYATITSKGTKMPRGSKIAIMKYLVPDLTLLTQQKVSDILSTYDDLIENNNRRIELLEKAAQNLYKEWFVRFQFPNHKQSKFVKGLPLGWEVVRLNEFVYVTDGTHDTPKQTESGYYLVTGRSINNDFIDFSKAYFISKDDHDKIKKRSGLDKGDILFSNIGTVGSVSIIDYDIDFSVKNVIILKAQNDIEKCYLYCLFKNSTTQAQFHQQTNGSSQQFISLGFMRNYKILIPQKEVLEKFAEVVEPIVAEKYNIYKQIRNLIKQRDLLLPRLMSGKIEL